MAVCSVELSQHSSFVDTLDDKATTFLDVDVAASEEFAETETSGFKGHLKLLATMDFIVGGLAWFTAGFNVGPDKQISWNLDHPTFAVVNMVYLVVLSVHCPCCISAEFQLSKSNPIVNMYGMSPLRFADFKTIVLIK
eukprot:jgi/Botrbrau1/23437/Bobra.0411s0001.1